MTQQTVRNRLLQGQPRARCPVARIPLTPSHCHLRHQCCQGRAHWRTEWRSVVLSGENRLCLGANDGLVLVRRRPGECLQPNCLQPKHTGPTPGVLWSGEKFHIQQQEHSRGYPKHTHCNFVRQSGALQSVDILPCRVRSPDLSPIEHVWNNIGRQLRNHPWPAWTIPVLIQ
ncbi:transposable element Tc1 transposase [Trichonephila clavipes]|nr:transposable element Tc1 transposase [Trichonephila clavipes]